MGQLEKVPGVQNWLERLPGPLRAAWHRSIIYRAAVHMHKERGMAVGHAIASAINWAEHIRNTGDVAQWKGPQTVNPKSVAEVTAALALWETMKATAKARSVATSVPAGERRALELAGQAMTTIDLARKITK